VNVIVQYKALLMFGDNFSLCILGWFLWVGDEGVEYFFL
jgi:hypothetical protein